ncbi:mechanosensitive ion channel domain-containing protein, partial [Parvibaculum sp.]
IARQAIVPMVLSLALLAFCLALHHLLTSAVTRFLGGHQPDERVAVTLLPFAIGLLVLVVSLPVFALIWGARLADISEVWILLTQGVEIAGINVSIGVVVTLVAVFVLGVFITRWLQRFLGTTVLPRTKLDSGGRNAVLTGLGYAGITLAALIAVSAAGLDLSNLAIVAGALSVGIGFGMQAIVSNFVSGIILLVERPIKEGDWIEVSGHSGIVRKIAVRSTRIQTFDRHDVIVPNSDLIAGTVKNMTLTSPTGRVIVPVGVAYGSDLEKTRQILLDAVRDNDMVLSFPEPSVLFMGLGESSLDFELRCFLKDVSNVLTARSDLLFTIYTELNKAGIEIPFPQRDITVRNVEDFARALCRPHTETDTGEPAEETPRTPGS